MAGNVPSFETCTSQSNPPPKAPPKPPLVPPFPLTNTILRHPYSNANNRSIGVNSIKQNCQAAGAIGGDQKTSATSLFASTSVPSSSTFTTITDIPSPCPPCRPLSISTIFSGYEHIPFITTPVPASTTPKSNTQSVASTSAATTIIASGANPTNRLDRSSSPASSSIQLSGSATPSAEIAATEYRETSTATIATRPSTSALVPNGGGPGRVPLEIYRVTLAKDKMYNDFGFSVSDGMQDKGVYINKIRTGGPADLSGNIKPFDRILQVDFRDLRNLRFRFLRFFLRGPFLRSTKRCCPFLVLSSNF